MLAIKQWLDAATRQLIDAGIPSARLDAELILAHTVRKGRTYLHAHGDDQLDERQVEIANARLVLRLDRVPVAYIVGHKEFYGRSFKVTTSTLIPRAESEVIIELLKDYVPNNTSLLSESACRLVDVGTGSGCLGITAKLEHPELDVTLLDTSRHALTVAEANATSLHASVAILRSDLLQHYPFTPEIILANLPYVDAEWDLEPELDHEPKLALFSGDQGLYLIKKLLEQAATRLTSNGIIILEADTRQHKHIITFANHHGYILQRRKGFILALRLAAA